MKDDGAALNRTVLAQFGKSVLGFDPVEKYEEICQDNAALDQRIKKLNESIAKKDSRIAELESDKRHLQDEMEEMDDVAEQLERKRKARVSKRVRFDDPQS
ncbi:hypothetical protein R3P38DRAFT_3207366 [Favolaschia claudopus]|uniref:Uncharacterized protein n=1 Tax=Favolaschia claudopus TaxID=2862362 RepID=A0AAW0AKD0_9AGAR